VSSGFSFSAADEVATAMLSLIIKPFCGSPGEMIQ
jgi:hypothetical protein